MYIKRKEEDRLKEYLKSDKVLVLLGARQVGKTTLIKEVLKGEKVVFFNFDIEVDVGRFFSLASLPPKDVPRQLDMPKYLVIDEVQSKPEAFRIVKGWFDSAIPIKIILLGSSSSDIAKGTAESLAGRNEKLLLPPLMFSEVLSVEEWYNSDLSKGNLLQNFSSQISEILLRNITFGSYPEVVTTSDRLGIISNLASDYLLKDVLRLGLVKDPSVIRKLIVLVARQIGSLVSVNELANTLGISRLTVERYLDLLERTFVIFRLPAYSTNPRKEVNKSQKIYFWDTGVRNAVLGELSINVNRGDMGYLWENWVVAEFAKDIMARNSLAKLHFWRSRGGSEIDLVVGDGQTLSAYEIKWSKGRQSTKAFEEAYGIKPAIIDNSNPLFLIK